MVAAQPHQLALTLVPRVDSTAVSRMLWLVRRLTYVDTLVCGRWCVQYIPRGGCGNSKYVVTYRGHVVFKVNMARGAKKDTESMNTVATAQKKLARYLAEVGIDWRKWTRVENIFEVV